jgi:hypothetical protein
MSNVNRPEVHFGDHGDSELAGVALATAVCAAIAVRSVAVLGAGIIKPAYNFMAGVNGMRKFNEQLKEAVYGTEK